ncbi:MAG: hypothetical protein PHP53_24695 [Prolixibacteraceae bacterium]|nr:hypothetical protein [Prolixibacteraceae bacterium]
MQESKEKTILQEADSTSDWPLLVIGYEKKRVIWTLFCPCSSGLLISFMIVFKWAFKDTGFMFWFMEIVGIISILIGILVVFELLYMESICLYGDKLMLKYKSNYKKDKCVTLLNAKYSAISTLFFVRFVIADDLIGAQFDPSLLSPQNSKAFYEMLSKISGRDIKELKVAFNSKLFAK